MTEIPTTRMEAACSLLSEPERRFLLYQLSEHRETNLEAVVSEIAAWKHETNPEEVDADQRHKLYISLVHDHLPRLADYDIIDYDLRSGDVVLADGFPDIKPLLAQFKQTESNPELRNHASL